MSDFTPDQFFEKFDLLIRILQQDDPLNYFSIHSGHGYSGEKKLLIFNPPNIFSNRIGISLVQFKTFSNTNDMIELALVIENESPLFSPFYPSELGYKFDEPKLFKNIQDIINELRYLSRELKLPYQSIQFGDFEAEEI